MDLHTGGIDHIPVHHTNEVAQAEAATGKKPWTKYWVHGEFLVIEKGKMAKSGDNFIILQTLIDKGYSPLDYRYFCFTAHYKSQLTFSWAALNAAKSAYEKLKNRVLEIKKANVKGNSGKKYLTTFKEYIDDDLNVPRALGVMWDMLKDSSVSGEAKYKLVLEFDKIFGLGLKNLKVVRLPAEVRALVVEREKVRKAKDWNESDRCLNTLCTHGMNKISGNSRRELIRRTRAPFRACTHKLSEVVPKDIHDRLMSLP